MFRVTLFLVAAAALVGCANTRRESAAAIQGELPQLIDACNGAFRDGREQGLGIVAIPQGLDACDRLALGNGLDRVRPATAAYYQRYRDAKTLCQAGKATESANFPSYSPSPCVSGISRDEQKRVLAAQ